MCVREKRVREAEREKQRERKTERQIFFKRNRELVNESPREKKR